MNFKLWLETIQHTIEPSQGDGWIIRTADGYIDYRHDADEDTNEIWWVESNRKGHGSELVDLMQSRHPAGTVAWGVRSNSGTGLMNKWHRNNPKIDYTDHPHDGQFDPFGNTDHQDELDDLY